MYETLLWLHSWWRWLVVLAGLVAVSHAWLGSLRDAAWLPRGRTLALVFVITLDLQLLLGLLLYGLASPYTQAAFADMGSAMRDPHLRFWAVEHGITMLLAVVFTHLGSVRARRAPNDALRYRRFAMWASLALLLILLAMPWPWLDVGRPLLRW